MITRVKILMVAIIATLSLASCSEDEPAKMLWEVSATPAENVKAAFDPSFIIRFKSPLMAMAEKPLLSAQITRHLCLKDNQTATASMLIPIAISPPSLSETEQSKSHLIKCPKVSKKPNQYFR